MPSSKWQQHVLCTQIIRRHRDWDDEQVLVEAGLHKMEINIVQEARREVESEVVPGIVRSDRSY